MYQLFLGFCSFHSSKISLKPFDTFEIISAFDVHFVNGRSLGDQEKCTTPKRTDDGYIVWLRCGISVRFFCLRFSAS